MDDDQHCVDREREESPAYEIGYKRPPVRSRFKPGVSGNPSGRAKGSQNLRTIFQRILKEEVSLREGVDVRKVSKAEAILRGLVIGALKGDARSANAVFRIAEQVGEFENPASDITQVQRVIVSWQDLHHGAGPDERDSLPSANSTGTDGP